MQSNLVPLLMVTFLFIATVEGSNSNYRHSLTSHSVAESPCISPPPAPAPNIDHKWAEETRKWYFPMASKFCYFLYAEVLQNRSAQSYQELGQMCLTNPFGKLNSDIIGFGERYTQVCINEAVFGKFHCTPVGGSAQTNPDALFLEQDVIVLTDNSTFTLNVRCVNGLYKDWQVNGIQPTISREAKRQIIRKITSLGFNPSNALELGCSCPYPI